MMLTRRNLYSEGSTYTTNLHSFVERLPLACKKYLLLPAEDNKNLQSLQTDMQELEIFIRKEMKVQVDG
jgi:hypothetical protein